MSITPSTQRSGLFDRLGFPSALSWGLSGLIVFLIGDGVEVTWLSNWLSTSEGYTLGQAGVVLTSYGIVVAIGAFLSGPLSEAYGPRRVMLIGLFSFIVFDVLFITVGLASRNLAVLTVAYALRGLGYPMFAYGLLTWIMRAADPARRSSAAGWFWFAFSLGLQILGSFAASVLLPAIGEVNTLWAGLILTGFGGVTGLALTRAPGGGPGTVGTAPLAALGRGLSILWRHPRIAVGGLVKVITLSGPLGLGVFYVPFIISVGLPLQQAILLFTVFGIVVVLGNLSWGFIADAIGWVNSMQWFGSLLLAAGFLYLYFVPIAVGPNFWIVALGTVILGAGVSAFVPLTPLVVAFAPEEAGNAVAVVNLGSGVAAFVGSGIASALVGLTGAGGVLVTYAVLNVAVFFLMFLLRLPGGTRTWTTEPNPREAGDAFVE